MVPVRLAEVEEVEDGVSLYPVEVACWRTLAFCPVYHSSTSAASPFMRLGVDVARGWGWRVPPPPHSSKRKRRQRLGILAQRRCLASIVSRVPGAFEEECL